MMKKLGLGVSMMILVLAGGVAGAAPPDRDAVDLADAAMAGPAPEQIARLDGPPHGTGCERGRAEKSRAKPTGPGLQFHRYPARALDSGRSLP